MKDLTSNSPEFTIPASTVLRDGQDFVFTPLRGLLQLLSYEQPNAVLFLVSHLRFKLCWFPASGGGGPLSLRGAFTWHVEVLVGDMMRFRWDDGY
jgi:hypothetical protein